MALLCTGALRGNRVQLLLYCSILSLIIYFLHGHKATLHVPRHTSESYGRGPVLPPTRGPRPAQISVETSWGAPVVWGASEMAARRRAWFTNTDVRTALIVLVVGHYAHFTKRFVSSAEMYFLPGRPLTYYVLTDNPRNLDPPPELGPQRELKVVPVAELPGWDRLHLRRTALIADTIRAELDEGVDYVFCADVDLEFVGPVGEEIFGDLVAVLHPELYGLPRAAFPYEDGYRSSACVLEHEGELYYTSELYGGRVPKVFRLARAISLLLLQDQSEGLRARGLEESYLNRYLIDHKPSCVLSPEYGWWESGPSARVPVQRVVSRGRQCQAYDSEKREVHGC